MLKNITNPLMPKHDEVFRGTIYQERDLRPGRQRRFRVRYVGEITTAAIPKRSEGTRLRIRSVSLKKVQDWIIDKNIQLNQLNKSE